MTKTAESSILLLACICLAGLAAVLGFAAPLTLGPFGLPTRALTVHPPNWIQKKLTTRRRTKPAGLIEPCTQGVGAPPQTPRKNVAGISAPRTPLGSAPDPRWASDLDPVGTLPQTSFRRGSGAESPQRGLGRIRKVL